MSEPSSPTPSPAPGQTPDAAGTPSRQEADGQEADGQEAAAAPEPVAAPVQVRLRRAPRYRAFVIAGAVVGVIAGVVASLLLADPGYRFSLGTTTGYLAAIGLLLGGLLGGAVAVLVERPPK